MGNEDSMQRCSKGTARPLPSFFMFLGLIPCRVQLSGASGLGVFGARALESHEAMDTMIHDYTLPPLSTHWPLDYREVH